LVDVNVHPTKLEVRFSKEKELTALIESIIKEAFNNLTLIPQVTQSKETKEKQKTLQMDAEQFHKDSLQNIDSFEPVVEGINFFIEGNEVKENKDMGLTNEGPTITEDFTKNNKENDIKRFQPYTLLDNYKVLIY